MKKANPKADWYFKETNKWQSEVKALRAIALGCDLDEELKWGKPCYTLEGSGIFLIHEFKDYCALLFFKGVLLQDANGILVQQTKNVQGARQLRFTNLREITTKEATIKAYINEAIKVEKAGLKVPMKETSAFAVPVEFQSKLDGSTELEAAFAALTPGRQRGYLLYFAAAKQSKTREARVEKCVRQILDGKGLDD